MLAKVFIHLPGEYGCKREAASHDRLCLKLNHCLSWQIAMCCIDPSARSPLPTGARQSGSSNLVLPDATASAAVPECVCIRMKQKKPSLNTLEHVRDERPHPPGQPCISRPLSWSAEATIPRVWEEFVIGLFASSTNPAATMRGWQAAKLQALRSPPPAGRVALEAKLRAAQHPGM